MVGDEQGDADGARHGHHGADGGPAGGRSSLRTPRDEHGVLGRVWRAGLTGWALVGIVVALAVLGFIASRVMLIWVPLVLALFPATLLVPVANWCKRRGVPAALASIVSIVGGILVIAAVIALMVPLVLNELPDLIESAESGVEQVEAFLADEPFGLRVGGLPEIMERAREQLGEIGELAPQAMEAAMTALETIIGFVLMLVVLFFYLKDGPRIARGIASTAPSHLRGHLHEVGERAWGTLGSYFRGQLLVALVDAVAIGIGLLVLGVPLAIPLAVLIFFGGLFPIVGATVTGVLAVLVALADAGLGTGIAVAALVILVQQIEGNVLEPLILGHAIRLHALVVLLAITAGAATLGILGAFLAVPVAAIVARTLDYVREQEPGSPAGEPARGPS